MNRHWIFILGLILSLGLGACTQSEPLAGASEGLLPPTDSPLPSGIQSSLTPTVSSTPFLPASPIPSPAASSTPTASPTSLACWSEGGHIEQKQIQTNWLPNPLKYRVYTPPCYDQQPDRRYPVLYLIHGQTYNDDQWDRLGADETADTLIAAGEIAPFIIVMPYDEDHYTPPPENHFGDALLHNLIQRIDSDYRTLTDRQYRAIGGLSRGGNWAVHIGLSYWGFFGSIGAHSTPTFVTDGPSVIRDWLATIPPDEIPRIYMDAGENDRWLKYTRQFEEVLNEEDIPHEWYLFPGEHEDAYWASHVEQYLRWYTQDW